MVYKNGKNNINYFVTSIVLPILLALQILYNVYIKNKNSNIYSNIFVVIACLYIFYRFNGYSIGLCKNKLSSPIWGSNELQLWELIIFAILTLYPNWTQIIVIILIIFPIIYIFIGGSFGSMWCAIANIVALKYLYLY